MHEVLPPSGPVEPAARGTLAGTAAKLAHLFRTHPPTEQRVARLVHVPVRTR